LAYIDTSVLVAYYWPETLSRAAQSAIRKTDGPAISPLVEAEFHSALALKTRTGEMDVECARRVMSMFRLHRADGIYRVVPVEAREYAIACEWIATFRTQLRTLDALHLATAFSNGLTMITADKVLAESATCFGVKHRLIV
jgi:predicted nucleic acid-binding protein